MLASRSSKAISIFLPVLFLACLSASGWAQSKSAAASPELRADRYFLSVRNQPLLLHIFLEQMPKGGDLHNHLSGSVYAESFIAYAVQDGLCIERNSLSFTRPPCEPGSNMVPASAALKDAMLYGRLLDALSMRQFIPGAESGHDHFFATFGKFEAVSSRHTADMLAEVRSRAASGHLQYMELMFNPDGNAAGRLGTSLGWNDDLAKFRDQLLNGGLTQIVANASKFLDETEKQEQEKLRCGQSAADPGCGVKARYLYQVARGLPKENVFAQILAGFEMASKDSRVVGLNLVMPEDAYLSVHDFDLHMRMLDFLHGLYPQVHVTLHAGELTQNLVPPEDLYHIRASIQQGHAKRIGHGVDVMQEPEPMALLRMMADKKVLVEVCLTSNDVILGVTGDRHPLPMYLKYGVPVALATDDPGVSRGDITQEYQRAAETYHLSYHDLKKFARASLAFSFLPGDSIWKDSPGGVRASACAAGRAGATQPSPQCAQLLAASEKAQQEWALEKAFTEFESKF
jgi:adenosine deaminase